MPYEFDLSDYVAELTLEWVFHNTPLPAPPTEIELSLHTEGGPLLDGTNLNEVVSDGYTGYERITLQTAYPSEFSDVTIVDGWRRVVNLESISWGTAEEEWHDGEYLIDTIGVWDKEVPQNLLFRVQMTPREINPGPVQIAADTLGGEM